MTDKETRKRLINSYKERSQKQTGGVYIIKNKRNGKIFLDASPDIEAALNRFSFAQQTGSCVNVKLNDDWSVCGSAAFEFEIAETIAKNEAQSPTEFREDLQLLKSMWIEKFNPSVLY